METIIKKIKNVGQGVSYFINDLAIWQRNAKSGRLSFAIGYDGGGRQFPVFFSQGPMRILKQEIAYAIRGARIIRKRNAYFVVCNAADWKQAVEMGVLCTPVSGDPDLEKIRAQARERFLGGHGIFSTCPGCDHPRCNAEGRELSSFVRHLMGVWTNAELENELGIEAI